MTPTLVGIRIFPIKSLDGISCSAARIVAGALENDRRFAVFDAEGRVVNGKRTDRVHSAALTHDPISSRSAVERELCECFGFEVHLRENAQGGFPDDDNASGPTIVSTATLAAVASWFPGLSVESVRERFRANLEIDGVPPFWEDRLFGEPDTVVKFAIGGVSFDGVNPCQRCVVPTRDPSTGHALPGFQSIFRERREQTLPAWAPRSRFNHFYRLAVNTRIPISENGKILRVGDSVTISSDAARSTELRT
jgi:uncharacterized protein YcbX